MSRLNMMRAFVGGAMCLLLTLPVLACGRHGINAGSDLQTWISDNWTDSETQGSMGAWGGQDKNSGTKASWSANSHYWVRVSLPDGEVLAIDADPSKLVGTVNGGGAMEHYLVDEMKKKLNDWFKEFRPDSEELDDYIG